MTPAGLLALALLSPVPATQPQDGLATGSEEWYAAELEVLVSSIELTDEQLVRRAEYLPWFLSNPDRAQHRPPLSLERRIELYAELVTLARELPAFAGKLHEWVSSAAVLVDAAGGPEAELAYWREALELAPDVYQRTFALLSIARLLNVQARLTEALPVLDEVDRILEEARGPEGLAPELEDNRVWALDERFNAQLRAGLFRSAAGTVEELWSAATDAVERLRDERGELPSNFARSDAAVNWVQAALARLVLSSAQLRFRRTASVFEELAQDPTFQEDLDEAQRARILLRLAIAEVEGLRSGVLPEATPLDTLDPVIAALPMDGADDLALDGLLARWYRSRVQLDAGDVVAARAAFEAVVDAYESRRDLLVRFEQLVAAQEAALLRADPAGGDLGRTLARLEDAYRARLADMAALPEDAAGRALLRFEEWNMAGSELIALHLLAQPGESGVRAGLERVIEAQQLGTLARRLASTRTSTSGPTIEDVQHELLLPGEGALVYWLGREQNHAFLIDAERVRHVSLGPDFELERVREELSARLHDIIDGAVPTAPEELDAPLRDAADFFLPPEVQHVLDEWTGLAIVGIESLGFVPFELLPLASGEELGLAKAVRHWSSLPVAWSLFERRAAEPAQPAGAPGDLDLVLFAAPRCGVPSELAEDYAFGAAESEALVRAYRSERRLVIAGPGPDGATAERLLSLDFTRAPVAQILVHGEQDPRRTLSAGLRAWNNGEPRTLWAEELAGRLRFPELTILSACEAGRAVERLGDDGVGHLGAVCFLSGSSTVLLSYTPVGYRPMLALTARFHERLAEHGESPVQALHAARREMVAAAASPVERLHAFLVHVSGLGDRPLFAPGDLLEEEPAGPRPFLVGAVLALAACLGWAAARVRRARS